MSKRFTQAVFVASLTLGAVGAAQAQEAVPTAQQPRAYIVASYDIKDQAMFEKYMNAAPVSLLDKYHGKMIIFNTTVQGVEGKPRSVFGMVEFPSLADAQRFYHSPEYTIARKLRFKATKGTSTVIFLEGLPQ